MPQVYELATFCKAHRNILENKLLLLSLEWPSSLNPFKREALSEREKSWFANFSCLQAKCYKPSDRAMLLAAIRAKWGSEEDFDRFVRTDLLEVMRESKARFRRQLRDVAAQSFDMAFTPG